MNILTIPQVQAFLATIRERPFDTSARLVYADWLEDNGHTKAARRQREYARMIESSSQYKDIISSNAMACPVSWKNLGCCFAIGRRVWYMLPDGTLRMQSPAGNTQRRVTRMSVARLKRRAYSERKQTAYAVALNYELSQDIYDDM